MWAPGSPGDGVWPRRTKAGIPARRRPEYPSCESTEVAIVGVTMWIIAKFRPASWRRLAWSATVALGCSASEPVTPSFAIVDLAPPEISLEVGASYSLAAVAHGVG